MLASGPEVDLSASLHLQRPVSCISVWVASSLWKPVSRVWLWCQKPQKRPAPLPPDPTPLCSSITSEKLGWSRPGLWQEGDLRLGEMCGVVLGCGRHSVRVTVPPSFNQVAHGNRVRISSVSISHQEVRPCELASDSVAELGKPVATAFSAAGIPLRPPLCEEMSS